MKDTKTGTDSTGKCVLEHSLINSIVQSKSQPLMDI